MKSTEDVREYGAEQGIAEGDALKKGMEEKWMKTLDRQKRDVTNRTRNNIFGWHGQFTPEFVAAL